MRGLLFLIPFFFVGCSTVKGLWTGAPGNQDDRTAGDQQSVRGATNHELELKLAKVWAKVDELEQRQLQQSQKIRVLEKGLMLGIIPDELKNPAEISLKRTEPQYEDEPMLIEKPRFLVPADSSPPASTPLDSLGTQQEHPTQLDAKTRDEILRDAQAAFEKGRYGKAIALYSELPSEPGNNQDYWIALCWYRLKEYETSHKIFSEFVSQNPDSPWIARARFNLARVDYELGYRERAVKQMQDVIQKFPTEDAAQMARASLQAWEKAL